MYMAVPRRILIFRMMRRHLYVTVQMLLLNLIEHSSRSYIKNQLESWKNTIIMMATDTLTVTLTLTITVTIMVTTTITTNAKLVRRTK